MSQPVEFWVRALTTLPEFLPGDDLARAVADAAEQESLTLSPNSMIVVAQKAVSKVEGRFVDLRRTRPSARAQGFAEQFAKDPRLVQVVLDESRRIVRMERGVIISETKHGYICANAGVDRSNVPSPDHVTLLPEDPDRSAQEIREGLRKHTGVACPVIISDTFGRPWRKGLTNVALGVAGMGALLDERGTRDLAGRVLTATLIAFADEVASAAGLLMTKAEGRPVVIVSGLYPEAARGSARDMIRPREEDLFR